MGFSSDIPLQSNQSSISLEIPDVDNPAFKETLSLYLKRSTDSLNTKEGALYNQIEQANFQQWFPTSSSGNNSSSLVFRNGYRKVFNVVPIASGVTFSFAHGITGLAKLTRMWGGCKTATGAFLPIPYASATAVNQQIEIKADATNITIINGAGQANLTEVSIVIEYLKTT